MTEASTSNLSVRPDLVHREIEIGNSLCWVTHDPIGGKYFYFSPAEHETLMLADGNHDLNDLASDAKKRIQGLTVTQAAIESFFAQASANQLLTKPNPTLDNPIRHSRPWWSRILAVRFPGVDPDRFLTSIAWIGSALFSSLSFWLLAILGTLTVLLTLSRLDVWMGELAQSAFFSGSTGVAIVLAISLTKLAHELAHALACKHVRCDCREMGMMLLCGIPCLYVDVSDAWMLRRPRDRMLVSAAGMMAECWIAVLATFVWLATDSGPIHQISLVLMVVCSLSTLIINGNPLLRYDGYYLLSDAVGIPNMASESRRVLKSIAGVFFGNDHAPSTLRDSTPRKVFLASYGLLSVAYRWFVFAVILGVLYFFADSVGLGFMIVGIMVITLSLATWERLGGRRLRRSAEGARPSNIRSRMFVGGLAASVILAIGLIPLPRRVVVPCSITAADSHDIFVSTPGYLIESPRYAAVVQPNDPIVRLYNAEIQRKRSESLANVATNQTRLRVIRQSRSENDSASDQIPVLTSSLGSSRQRAELLEQRFGSLVIHSPVDGMFYPPASSPVAVSPVSLHRKRDLSDRLSPTNEVKPGMWIPSGTVLGSVGHPRRREAIGLVGSRGVGRLKLGQRATLLGADHPKGKIVGTVVSVSTAPVDSIPEWFSSAPRNESDASKNLLANSLYRVRVEFAEGDYTLPVHRRGELMIEAQKVSLISRLTAIVREALP